MASRVALRASTLARHVSMHAAPAHVPFLHVPRGVVAVRGYKERHMHVPPYSGYKVDTYRDQSPLVTHPAVYGADPGPAYASARVQALLRRATGLQPARVFRKRDLPHAMPAPNYVFMTDAQLAQARLEASRRAGALLQMPPVVACRPGSDSDPGPVICRDPALSPLKAAMVFTDISLGVPDSKRLIVVRERDGTLRHASYDQRHRCNQIYNPRVGRTHRHPDMFREESFKPVLEGGHYERLLDRAIVHLEPDDNLYQSVCARVYDDVYEKAAFQKLRSTRHFGPLTFYLAWNKKIDKLLVFFLDEVSDMQTASDVVKVFAIIHSDCATAKFIEDNEVDDTESEKYDSYCSGAVESYLRNECQNRGSLDLAIKNYKEAARAKAEFEIKKAEKVSAAE